MGKKWDKKLAKKQQKSCKTPQKVAKKVPIFYHVVYECPQKVILVGLFGSGWVKASRER